MVCCAEKLSKSPLIKFWWHGECPILLPREKPYLSAARRGLVGKGVGRTRALGKTERSRATGLMRRGNSSSRAGRLFVNSAKFTEASAVSQALRSELGAQTVPSQLQHLHFRGGRRTNTGTRNCSP